MKNNPRGVIAVSDAYWLNLQPGSRVAGRHKSWPTKFGRLMGKRGLWRVGGEGAPAITEQEDTSTRQGWQTVHPERFPVPIHVNLTINQERHTLHTILMKTLHYKKLKFQTMYKDYRCMTSPVPCRLSFSHSTSVGIVGKLRNPDGAGTWCESKTAETKDSCSL